MTDAPRTLTQRIHDELLAAGKMRSSKYGSTLECVLFPEVPDHTTYRSEPLRLGLITPSLQLGGAERWILSLLKHIDRRCIMPTGVGSVLTECAPHYAPILEQCRSLVPVQFGINHIRSLLKCCDIVVAWGVKELTAAVDGFNGPVVFVSHGAGAGDALKWTQNTIRCSVGGMTPFAAVSQSAATAFAVDNQPRQVTIIHNGVELARCMPHRVRLDVRRDWGLRDDEIAVGYIGRFSPEKRPEAAAIAASALGAPYRAVLVGDGWCRDSTISLAKSICANAIIMPAVEHVGDALTALDCFILASPAEGFSLALTEAWVSGIPTIATAVGAVPDIERSHGPVTVKVSVGADANELAAAVRLALSPSNGSVLKRAQDVSTTFYSAEAMGRRWTEYLLQVFSEE